MCLSTFSIKVMPQLNIKPWTAIYLTDVELLIAKSIAGYKTDGSSQLTTRTKLSPHDIWYASLMISIFMIADLIAALLSTSVVTNFSKKLPVSLLKSLTSAILILSPIPSQSPPSSMSSIPAGSNPERSMYASAMRLAILSSSLGKRKFLSISMTRLFS
ncbi:hypothetical protein Entas_3062 [Enterobacter soli]|nr:hypothetical protein Entas_3062 [Enterobacter soli]